MFHYIKDEFSGILDSLVAIISNPLALLTLPMAVYLYLYYCYKKQTNDCQADTLTLVRHLSKDPYHGKINENLCISLMQKSSISPNSCSLLPYKTTLFLLACFGGSLKLVEFMLNHGADPHQTNQHGDGAFYFAVYGIVCRLKNSSGRIPRSAAIQQGVLLIDALTNLGCDINLENVFGFTPLHWAVISKEQWLISHLLSRGAVGARP